MSTFYGTNDEKVRTFWIRDPKNNPVACLATFRDYQTVPNTLLYAVSTYNPIDQFNRKMGRDIAVGRLKSKHCSVIHLKPGENIKREVLYQIMSDASLPHRIRNAAGYRLSIYTAKLLGINKKKAPA
jgi:hypothetical protein